MGDRSGGRAFVGNPTNFDMALDPGSRLGIVVAGAAQTRHCWACGADDSEMVWGNRRGKECSSCRADAPLMPLECRQCGAGPGEVEVRGYSGCASCHGGPMNRCEARQQAVLALSKPDAGRERPLWAMAPCSVAAGTEDRDTRKCPVYHIVEQPGGIERMLEVEIPPEAYYEALRQDLEERRS